MTLDIFIPFWGDPALLYQTVDSVRAQRNPDWRLTVIDDCYPGDEVAAYFSGMSDERISYVRNDVNVGITENFRESVRRSVESHITILGCDDLLHPNYVDVVSNIASRFPSADVIQPGVQVIDEDGAVTRPLVDRVKQRLLAPRRRGAADAGAAALLRGEAMATSLIRGDWLYWPSLTFRTETLRAVDFRDGLAVIQDLALLMDIAFAGGSLVYAPELAFSYRRHRSSASQKTLLDGRRFRDERAYYGLAHDLAVAQGWKRTARTARLRLISRMHAATEVPGILRHGDRNGLEAALAHIFLP